MEIYDQYPETDEERVRYDSPGFPLYIVQGNLIMFRDMAVHCHWHEDFELICVLKGYMDYHVNGTVVRLNTGEGIFVNSRQLHFGCSADGTDCDYLCVLISHSLLSVTPFVSEHFLHPVSENSGMPFLHLRPDSGWQSELLALIRQAFAVYRAAETGFQLEIEAIFLRMLATLYRHMPVDTPPASAQKRTELERMKAMLSFIAANRSEPLTLETIAASAGISAGTCTRLFRHHLHRTPVEYLIGLRLEQGAELLRDTGLSVTEIAYRSGFSDASYFTRRFRERYGCTPKSYRRQSCEARTAPSDVTAQAPG